MATQNAFLTHLLCTIFLVSRKDPSDRDDECSTDAGDLGRCTDLACANVAAVGQVHKLRQPENVVTIGHGWPASHTSSNVPFTHARQLDSR